MHLNLIGSSNPNKVYLILGLPGGAACAGLWAPECLQHEHQLPSFLNSGLGFLYLLPPGPEGIRSQASPALLLLPPGVLLHTLPTPAHSSSQEPFCHISHCWACIGVLSNLQDRALRGSSHILTLPVTVSQSTA